ncbi:MAG: CsbD family protein [Kutzneria sp.]|nr:CsbD family protein [Kutzneria sp.]MBV9847951.1 CsbD family protein [Kutzneria sp.]
MSASDKIDNKAEELKGKAKEGAGKVADDKDLETEGQFDQLKGKAKQAGEKVKDIVSDK